MNYKESVEYLENLSSLGIHLGLDRINSLLSKLGDPHKDFKSIIVAGTNGKGSVCAMLEAVLVEAGFKVGMYTSPHLLNYRERVRINGEDIGEKRFAEIVARVKENIGKMNRDLGDPTLFEALTAAAFIEFSEKKVDVALLEVGLGGRLDATNAVKPIVSVITNVDYDHTEILGNDIRKIALEKAGVIKEGVPFVTAAEGAVLDLLVGVANETHAPVYLARKSDAKQALPLASDYISMIQSSADISGLIASFNGRYGSYENIKIPLIGPHQARNLGAVVAVIEALKDNGIDIAKHTMRSGLLKTKWRGRFEIVSREPLVILDCAHNPGGAEALKRSLQEIKIAKPLTIILGMLSNKDIDGFSRIIVPLADRLVATRSSHPKAALPDEIAEAAAKYCANVSVSPKVSDALDEAFHSGVDNPVCVTGSLFTVADAIRFLEKNSCVH